MIAGAVNSSFDAVIQVQIHGSAGDGGEIDAVIDTGFNGFLTLPPALLKSLGVRRLSRGRAVLANGTEELFDIYGVTVVWDGQPRNIEADAVDATPLIGMFLLAGFDLHIQVAAGGKVVIEASAKSS